MCGIAGIVGADAIDGQVLEGMAAAMTHRGPDGEGVWREDGAGLAFRRLAIIDLDARSNQPLHLGPLHLVFNGELYNYVELREELRALGHSFRTEGDAEVLLHSWAEWGEKALERFNGMFAFAVWNDAQRRLVLATDPFAEKPLYFHHERSQLMFASDVRALCVADQRLSAPDEQAVAAFTALGVMPVLPRTFFASVKRLPPAHLAVWDKQVLSSRRYWNPAFVQVPRSLNEAAMELRGLLLDSTRLRLRSDVTVGTSLSGGIDSSAIVGLTGELSSEPQRHAFTATFPGFERDEWNYASLAASAAGVLKHHAVQPTAEDFLRDIERVLWNQEEPFGSTSIYAQWRVMQAAREAGVTVLLDGQGADELFAGYVGMDAWATRSLGWRAVLRDGVSNPLLIRRVVSTYLSRGMPSKFQRWQVMRNTSPYVTESAVRSFELAHEQPADWDDHGRPLRRELMHQAFRSLLPDICRFADKNSMAHSVEVRLPFLDRRIAEFAFSLPAEWLVGEGMSKRVLRAAVTDIMPAEILSRRDKVAYATPEHRWLTAPAVRQRSIEILSDPSVQRTGRYNLRELEGDAAAGEWRDVRGLWRAVNTELWLRAYSQATAGA